MLCACAGPHAGGVLLPRLIHAACHARPTPQEFPLSVALTLRTPGAAAPALSVAFRYLPALGLVTAAGARPEQDAVLAGLFPGDDGGALPGPVPGSAGEAAGGGGEVDVRQLQGRPYRWALACGFVGIVSAGKQVGTVLWVWR